MVKLFGFLKDWFYQTTRHPRVLVIDDWAPDLRMGAGAPRAIQLLRALAAAGASVSHFATSVAPHLQSGKIARGVKNVRFIKWRSGDMKSLQPFLVAHHAAFDVILISRPHNMIAFNAAMAIHPVIATNKLLVYDAEAIFAEREIIRANVLKQGSAGSHNAVRDEIELAREAQLILVVNEHAAAMFSAAGYADVQVLRHAIAPDIVERPPPCDRDEVLFVGPTYDDSTPNSDSVVWFVDLVLPLLRAHRGSLALTLVGQTDAPAIKTRMDGRINSQGPLLNLDAAYNSARVFVAPTRFAAGVPLKIYDAAAHGVPCVVTSLLAGQLGWRHEHELLIADTPEDFSMQCLRLFDDEQLWLHLRANGYARAMLDCDVTNFNKTVADICRQSRTIAIPASKAG